ncbi:MAG: hypothetical protein ABL986_05885 [Vicinamibacterales bacterium]
MKADYEANPSRPTGLGGTWYKLVKENAECGCRYADNGLYATLMYQWTGEARYVDLAWAKITEFIAMPVAETSGNYVREYGIEHVIILDWLWPGLSQSRRDQLSGAVSGMLNNALTGNQWTEGYRMDDSDLLVGTYFAVAAFQQAFPTHPLASALFGHPQTGGLRPTALDQSTARNSINLYVTSLAEGGEWIESSEYNLGTVALLMMGVESIRTATGVDNFPEVTQWLPKWAERAMAFWTPDLQATYQWGDVEHPRVNTPHAWSNVDGLAAGLLQGTPEGARLQQQFLDLVAKYGSTGYQSMEPITGRLFLTFNPYAPATEWRTNTTFYAAGAGLLLHKSGFNPQDSLFTAHFATRRGKKSVDHVVRYTNDFELWRNGEWVLTHPRGYGGAPNSGDGTNAVLMHGFGDMWEFKEVTSQSAGEKHAFLQGTTGGAAVQSGHYDPPPVFVQEWTRAVLYVSGNTDTVVVFDRANVDSQVQRRDRYYASDLGLVDQASSPKQWLLHMPVSPTIGSNNVAWSTPGGQPVKLTTLLPSQNNKVIVDERALRGVHPAWGGWMELSELKYQVRISPKTTQPWDTFLNVIQVGTPGAVTLRTVTGQIEGAHISRNGESDILALFNAVPSSPLVETAYDGSHDLALRRAHFRASAFTMNWSALGTSTEVFIADLDPRKQWAAFVNGVSVSDFHPESDGFATFTVPGAGLHSLSVTVVGENAATPSVPTGLRILTN